MRHSFANLGAIAAVMLMCNGTDAQELDNRCRPLIVYFGNGVNTENAEAHASARAIRLATDPNLTRFIAGYPVQFQVAYNPTKNILLDLLEAFSQKVAEDPMLTWSMFFRFITGQFVSAAMAAYLDDYYNNLGARKFSLSVSELSSPRLFADPTVLDHAQLYRSAMLTGHRVVVVAHSQGALYANAAYTYLRSGASRGINLEAFAIAAVASPANSVVTGEGHLTSATDLVIQAVRAIAPSTLPSNDSSVGIFPPEDRWGHSFGNIYFNTKYAVRKKTEALIMASIGKVLDKPATAPTVTDFDAIAASTTFNGTPLAEQFADDGMSFEGLTVYRNDGDPHNPNNQRFIPKLPNRIGFAIDTTGRGRIKLNPNYKVSTVTIDHRSASGLGIGVTTRLGFNYGVGISAGPFGLLGSNTTVLPVRLDRNCAADDSIETVEFERMHGDPYIIDRVQIN